MTHQNPQNPAPAESPDGNGPRGSAPLRLDGAVARRGVLGLGILAFLAACAPKQGGTMPEPLWTSIDPPPPPPSPEPAGSGAQVMPAPPPDYGGVIGRSFWAQGVPVPALMNPMLPVRFITVHHDGMTPFTATDQESSAARIEVIRTGHRSKKWGDIGYHFVVDRGGRVWEGRSLRWQGAHVEAQNEGNVGICCLGNFDEQSPSQAQLDALEGQLRTLMRRYGVPVSRIRTHQEWPTAHTACPGRSLQSAMVKIRRSELA
ncbi:MAG: peptidoglycan recognition family protein [Phycisphaerales bacterium]